jgi:CubicO group peptidase (beta-lactamase class C family)
MLRVPEEFYEELRPGLRLLFDPGEDWEYGLSTDVLGRVVEVASGMALDRYIDEQICQPLQMKDTFFKIPPEKKDRLVAAYHLRDGNLKRVLDGEALPAGQRPDYPYNKSHKYFSGGGGLCSTATDFMRFCQMLLSGGVRDGKQLLQESTVEMMVEDQLGGKITADQGVAPGLVDEFGFGFTSYGEQHRHVRLRGAYACFGFWTTSFRVSPKSDWILITMAQQPADFTITPKWLAEYERIAAEAIIE